MSGWNQESVKEALKAVLSKAAEDKAFRELTLKDPAAAVKQASGIELPQGYTVRFVDNEGADATFVLPDFIGDGELTDELLETVVGGKKKKKKDDDDDDKIPSTMRGVNCNW